MGVCWEACAGSVRGFERIRFCLSTSCVRGRRRGGGEAGNLSTEIGQGLCPEFSAGLGRKLWAGFGQKKALNPKP